MIETFKGQKLCIFISKNDKYEGIVLYELLLEIAFNSRLSGGTITIGDKGFFGDHNETAKLKILRSAENLPVVLEFQGRTDRVNRYIQRIEPMVKEALLTLADVQITKFNSPEEKAEHFEEKVNADQAKIFKESDTPSIDRSEPEPTGDSFAEPEQAGMHTESGEPVEFNKQAEPETPSQPEFSDPDQNQDETAEAEPIVEPESQPNIPQFDDDLEQAYDELKMDQPETPEDAAQTVAEPPIEKKPHSDTNAHEDQPEPPEFQTLEDEQVHQEPVAETFENESDVFDEADPDDDEAVMQLADFSETPAEEKAENSFDSQVPDTETRVEDNPESEKPKTDEEIDALFAESAKEFESSFDDMIKQAGKTISGEEKLGAEGKKTKDTEPESSKADEADKDVNSETNSDDKNHIEKDLKNYFSELFIK